MAKAPQRKPPPRVTSRKTVVTETVEPGEGEAPAARETAGMGWEAGVFVITSAMLLLAILLVDFQLGRDFGAGVFF